jgi:proline iminopeptidase
MAIIPIRGASLFVNVIGHGPPLVLMHGGPGLDHTTLLPLQPLSEQFTLVFYDHRCNGRSEGAEVTSMTWENLAADADALRQTLGFDRWAVLGHSFGGMVALEYALRYPQCLTHLLLMDTCADSRWVLHNAPELLAKRGYSPAAVQAARRFYTGQLAPGEFLPTIMKFISAYNYHNSPVKLARALVFGPHIKMRPEAFIFTQSQLLKGWTVMDRLREIQVPALVLAGRYDFLFPPEHQAILADRLPEAQLELIERAGHNPQSERPDEVIRLVRYFIAAPVPAAPNNTRRTG